MDSDNKNLSILCQFRHQTFQKRPYLCRILSNDQDNLSSPFSGCIYSDLDAKLVENVHKKRYFTKNRLFPRSKWA